MEIDEIILLLHAYKQGYWIEYRAVDSHSLKWRLMDKRFPFNFNDFEYRIRDMNAVFYESEFNGDISKWNTSNVNNMNSMFYKSNFNGDISKWNVSNVVNMSRMFYDSPLEKKLPEWYKRSRFY